jgi:hypothetical protein
VLHAVDFLRPVIVFVSRGSWGYENYFFGCFCMEERLGNTDVVCCKEFSRDFGFCPLFYFTVLALLVVR